jgi:predicted alpha-1,6-mannanase (GH76 family)
MITTTTASCISVIHDICSCKSHLHYITEIQGVVVIVIIWWCDLQLHMSYIAEIQGAVVVVFIWWCDLQLHMSHQMITTTTASCISVIHDICSC